MSGLNPTHVLEIIVEARVALGFSTVPDTRDALCLGTAIAESALVHIRQIGGGPALGLWQMEPATHDDLWRNFLAYRPSLATTLSAIGRASEELRHNLLYAAAMAHVHYYRVPQKLPTLDGMALANYWKEHYNTAKGAGVASRKAPAFQLAINTVKQQR